MTLGIISKTAVGMESRDYSLITKVRQEAAVDEQCIRRKNCQKILYQ
jgi:hypothetical protein